MLVSRTEALLAVLAFLSRSVAINVADERTGATKAAAGRKNTVFAEVIEKLQEKADKLMTEDEGYWERFLQATSDSIPSASPSVSDLPCVVEVDISCVDSEGYDCRQTPVPETPEDCIEPFTWTYTVENVGPACTELSEWAGTFLIIDQDGSVAEEVIDLLPKVPDDERNVCPGETFSVTETFYINLCQGLSHSMKTEVKASHPLGNSCEATDEWVVSAPPPCYAEVDITCVDSKGNECKKTPAPINPEDCVVPFTYTFTFEDIGPICMVLADWTGAFITYDKAGDVVARSPIDLLPVSENERNICPGETLSVTETLETDLCQGHTYKTTTEVKVDFLIIGPSCEAAGEYEVIPEADCATEVYITCVNSEGYDCWQTPVPETPEDCIEPFTWIYTVENVGPACTELSEWEGTFLMLDHDDSVSEKAVDLLSKVPDDERNVCPGETFLVTETVDTDLCQALPIRNPIVRTEVKANPPLGNSCEAIDEWRIVAAD